MTGQPAAPQPLRLAIFGTPRSGNTWFRALLKSAFGLPDFAEHDPAAVPWDRLPDRCLVNLHATPDEALRGWLRGIRPMVVSRHPLDALISILHFAPHHKTSNGWLLGRGGGEDAIRGVSPTSQEFFEYATGPRAGALLSISSLWWAEPGTVRVRYEDLIADTAGELERIAAEVGARPVRPIADIVKEHAIDSMRVRDRSHLHHMWKGQPGLWKHLIPPQLARAVAEAHPDAFGRPGYACDPDESLTPAQAEANWIATLAETNQRDTVQLWDLINAMRVAAAESKSRIAELEAKANGRGPGADARLAESDRRLAEALKGLSTMADQLTHMSNRAAVAEDRFANACQAVERLTAQVNEYYGKMVECQAQLAGTDPHALAVARRISRLTARFPWAGRKAKQVVSTARGLRRAA